MSSDDIWAVNPGGDLGKTIFHFNGNAWSSDGVSRGISPLTVWSCAKNDVWIAGGDGMIWRFQGTWEKDTMITIEGSSQVIIENMWGDAYDNIYAIGVAQDNQMGYVGLILHYDGIKWKKLNILPSKTYYLKIQRASNTGNNYFILGYQEDPEFQDTMAIYRFDGSTLVPLKKCTGDDFLTNLQKVGDDIVFGFSSKLWVYRNGGFKELLSVPDPGFLNACYGRNAKDLFLMMKNGIAHYNGDNIQYLVNFTGNRKSLTSGLLFEKEVFFVAFDVSNGLNLFYHGKVKE